MIHVKEARAEDLAAMLDDIRFADLAEWFAGTGDMFPPHALAAIESSEVSFTAHDEEGPLVIWGSNGGRLWMFATNRAERKAVSLHKALMSQVDVLHQKYGLLYCFVDCRNEKHIRWLKWLGFEELSEVALFPFGLPFKVYTKDTPDVL